MRGLVPQTRLIRKRRVECWCRSSLSRSLVIKDRVHRILVFKIDTRPHVFGRPTQLRLPAVAGSVGQRLRKEDGEPRL